MTTKNYFTVFALTELYYLPIYEPVARELKKQNLTSLFLVPKEYSHKKINTKEIAVEYLTKNGFNFRFFEDDLSDITAIYMISAANGYKTYNFAYQHSILMSHGIGTKGGYFDEEHTLFDIRFVEGEFRKKKMEELFPHMKTKLFDVGFAKLDPAINLNTDEKKDLVSHYHLDPKKKTILYSPTFYPSTIEHMNRKFPEDLKDYNIIIKPHAFTYVINTYKKQRKILKQWSQYENVFLAPLQEFNLTPFMAVSDVMITDESSAMFEFIALDKPMICFRDIKLRLTYRLFKKKFKKRMEPHLDQFKDSFVNAYSYSDLLNEVKNAIKTPSKNRKIRQQLSTLLVGKTDGKVSERIVQHLISLEKKDK